MYHPPRRFGKSIIADMLTAYYSKGCDSKRFIERLKDKRHIHLVYMTGTHSALNMFDEYSMINPRQLAKYVGFTEKEVSELCLKYNMNLEEMKEWYDGYQFENTENIYNPHSVVAAMTSRKYDTYWNQIETFEALRMYIDMNFEELRDDVLTLLVHLGYLGYDSMEEM